MLPTSRSNLWRLIGLYLFSFLVLPLLVLLTLEAFTRILCPEINHQDTERSLFAQNHLGQSLGWRPGAKGLCFGLPVEIDESGHRLMSGPSQWKTSWLILGDSVTFGVGVETEKTFVGLLQSAFPTVKIWNASVVGHNIENYKQVLLNFDLAKESVSKVILFYCLNDAEDALATVSNPVGSERVFAFLRRHSKFYMLLKGLVTDRSKSYFFHDLQNYDHANLKYGRAVKLINEMRDYLADRGIEFAVIILPYEYQLRDQNNINLRPQSLLTEDLRNRNICYYDPVRCFLEKTNDSRQAFLHADAMHLSSKGHTIIFDCIRKFLLDADCMAPVK